MAINDLTRDEKNEYLFKAANKEWCIELPQVGNCTRIIPLGMYSNGKLPVQEVRVVASVLRHGVQLHQHDVLRTWGSALSSDLIKAHPGQDYINSKKVSGETDHVGVLHQKAEKVLVAAVGYSELVMAKAREFAVASIKSEKHERPYRVKIEGGILPPMPRGDVAVGVGRDEFEGVSGVYFIHREHHLVYVGQAVNIGDRVKSHHHAAEQDRMCIVEVPRQHLIKAEDFYIWSLRPPLNKEWKHSYLDGELSGSPLSRFLTEKQPEPTQRSPLTVTIPCPSKAKYALRRSPGYKHNPVVIEKAREALRLLIESTDVEVPDVDAVIDGLVERTLADLESEGAA